MILDRTIPPAFKDIEQISIVHANEITLDNGVKVHTLFAGTEKVVRFELIFKAGHWYEPYNGVSYFTTKLLSAGTKNHSAKEIEEKIAFYGAFLDIITGYDRSSIVIYALSKHLPSLLPLLSEMVKESVFPDEELENLRKISLQHYKVNQQKTSFLASQKFRKSIFGIDHPYSRTIDEEAILKVNKDELINFYNSYFGSSGLDIVVSGNTEEDLIPHINTWFGKETWGLKPRSVDSYILQSSAEKNIVIEKSDSVQSSIRLGKLLFPINHPDYFKLSLLIEIYGGYFGSRLMKNIREEKGFTYGINASFHSLKNAGYLVIGTDVNKENTSNTIGEIFHEMKIMKNELVDKEELTIVKNYLLGSFLSSIATPFGLADRFKTIYFHEMDYNFYDQYIKTIKNTSSEDLIEMAKKYFKEDEMMEVICGGK
jgi:predicted Zn-dependent peptidase